MLDRSSVRAAALVMDEVKPDWYQHVEPLLLDLQDEDNCVCGQNGLDWNEVFYDQHYDLSFCTSDPAYEPLWLEEIALRMESARTVTPSASVKV